ncbi:MAG: YiiD C-terminal domain-containing protein [Porticoccaceae bacterium]|nr:YiiD C-terminal domain-containing protein [Porticoccaceae bacterium]
MDLKQHYQQAARDACPIYTFLDLQVESIEGGIYRSRMPLNDNTKNHVNIFHAGPMWMTAEYLGGLIATHNLDDPKYQPVIAGLNITFLRPAMTDITAETEFSPADALTMKTALESTGRFSYTLHIVIKDTTGKVVAEADGQYVVKDFSNLM